MKSLTPVAVEEILKAFPELIQPVSGDTKILVNGPCSQEAPQDKAICFIADAEYLPQLLKSSISALVVHVKVAPLVKAPPHIAVMTSKNTKLAMALVNQKFFKLSFLGLPFDNEAKIHPTAVISKSATVAAGAIVGPNATISEHVTIGRGVQIGAGAFIGPHTSIGADTNIFPLVHIGHSCVIGERCEVKPNSVIGTYGLGYARDEKGLHHRLPHYGGLIFENDVHVGANSCIDAGTYQPTIIGAGTKIDNHCHLAHNSIVGKNCIITAGFIMAGSSSIGDNCVFAGNAAVNGHISICSNCQFAPYSGIASDVTKPGVYGGYPVIPFTDSKRVQTSLQHLPRLRRSMARVLKHLGLSDNQESEK